MNQSTSKCIEFQHLALITTSVARDLGLSNELTAANEYINSYSWTESVLSVYLGDHFEGTVTILLFYIEPRLIGVDDYLWVIVGEVPTAYITAENCPNPKCALDGYIGAIEDWVSAVKSGGDMDEVIPLDLGATLDNALLLQKKLDILDKEILPMCKGDL